MTLGTTYKVFGSSISSRMSGSGAYDMVGDVKEWCWNESQGLRYILGGAWDDQAYMAVLPLVKSPFDRSPANARPRLRCPAVPCFLREVALMAAKEIDENV